MSTTQFTGSQGHLRGPFVAALVVAAFAVGGLTGIGLARASNSANHPAGADGSTVHTRAIPGAAVNNMSDAATKALDGAVAIPGAAVNNMSDAAAKALDGAVAIPGAAVNNMSDAAAKALDGAVAIPGAAVNNMSDAAAKALDGNATLAIPAGAGTVNPSTGFRIGPIVESPIVNPYTGFIVGWQPYDAGEQIPTQDASKPSPTVH
jgi:hypothetical protein